MSSKCPTNQFGFPLCARLIGGVPHGAQTALKRLRAAEASIDAAFAKHGLPVPLRLQAQMEMLHRSLTSLVAEVARENVAREEAA